MVTVVIAQRKKMILALKRSFTLQAIYISYVVGRFVLILGLGHIVFINKGNNQAV